MTLMVDTTKAKSLSPEDFKRHFGVKRTTFEKMVEAVQPSWCSTAKRGVKPKLGLSDRVLVALEYWREYRTYFHIGNSWCVSESTVCRIVHWVEEALMRSGCFRIPGKKKLVRGFGRPDVTVIDVTETPIERPRRGQKQFYCPKALVKTMHFQCKALAETFKAVTMIFYRTLA